MILYFRDNHAQHILQDTDLSLYFLNTHIPLPKPLPHIFIDKSDNLPYVFSYPHFPSTIWVYNTILSHIYYSYHSNTLVWPLKLRHDWDLGILPYLTSVILLLKHIPYLQLLMSLTSLRKKLYQNSLPLSFFLIIALFLISFRVFIIICNFIS